MRDAMRCASSHTVCRAASCRPWHGTSRCMPRRPVAPRALITLLRGVECPLQRCLSRGTCRALHPALPCCAVCGNRAPVPPYRLPQLQDAPVTPQECVRVIIAQPGHVAPATELGWAQAEGGPWPWPLSPGRGGRTLGFPEDGRAGGCRWDYFHPSQARRVQVGP